MAAKQVTTTKAYTTKPTKKHDQGTFGKTVTKDTSKMTARQKYKLAKQELKNASAAYRTKQTTIRTLGSNISQAIAGASGSIVSGQMQSEMTKRARIESAAKQATQGGLSEASDSRDDDEEKDTKVNPWAFGKRK